MHKQAFLFVCIFVGCQSLEAAQVPRSAMAEADGSVTPTLLMLRGVSVPVPVEFVAGYQNSRKPSGHFSFLLRGTDKPEARMESLPLIVKVKTLIFSSSSLPLVQFLGGRFEMAAFQSTQRIQFAQLGVSSSGGMQNLHVPQQSYPGEPRAVHLSGLSLNFRFGRDWRSDHGLQGWRGLPRILGALLN